MYFLYVDESGDTGMGSGSPTDFFNLSGIVIHELQWHKILEEIVDFRKRLKSVYGLKLREEIHSTDFLHHPGKLARIPKSMRLRILRDVLDFEATLSTISIINVITEKASKATNYDVFENTWKALFQRFHNTITHRNFPGPQNPQDYGIVIVDKTHEPKLRSLLRRLRKYNPVPSHYSALGYRDLHLLTLVEDPVHRDSLHSYFIQFADVNAYFLFQKERPCGYIRRKGARNYFNRLNPVLCTFASRSDPQGVVRL